MRNSKASFKQKNILVCAILKYVQMLTITLRGEEVPIRVTNLSADSESILKVHKKISSIQNIYVLFSHEQLWNCEGNFQNISIINSGFTEGKSSLSNN
jgi:hypothetical protein